MTKDAHYSIHHQSLHLTHLQPGKRQRHFKGVLLLVHRGSGLLQLGRHHYPLTAGEAAFLPADTLFAWHGFAGTVLSRVTLSPRLPQPGQAGRLSPSVLLAAIAGRLADWQGPREWQGAHGRLCRALYDELLPHDLLPFDAQPPLHQLVGASPAAFSLPPALQADFRQRFGCDADSWRRQATLLLVLRDLARGEGLDRLLRDHGFSSMPQFEQDCRHWLGTPCHQGGKTG
ncbi:hypothetical protein C7H85_14830 [Zobellella endophytica]|uniref:AraC family transcriptional regulator n=1 Tax=Zobellella endophytica TaxID=2116700 RepID=A0A2P7R1E1_9GAMM|nr:hypothetical protein [Zobellella endophytica]PSJ44023.1 hypothetical protein C7H85_14830 [Zobellella endophytica]